MNLIFKKIFKKHCHRSEMIVTCPSNRGGLNLRSVSLLSPAALSAPIHCMLGFSPDRSPHIPLAVSALATSAVHPVWQDLDDIDVPLQQKSLSAVIDEAQHQKLISSAPSTRARALALSSGLAHAAWGLAQCCAIGLLRPLSARPRV